MTESVAHIEDLRLDFVAAAVGRAIVRKVAGYQGGAGSNVYSHQFVGLSEQDIVVMLGKVLDAVGYDVYYEARYTSHDANRADIYAKSWLQQEAAIWGEVKVIFDAADNRLNKARFYDKREILKDVDRTHGKDGVEGRRLLLITGFSSTDTLEQSASEAKTMTLRDVVEVTSGELGPHCSSFCADLSQQATTSDKTKFLHVFVWVNSARQSE